MASQDAPDGQIEGFEKRVGLKAFEGVVRAGRLIAAGAGCEQEKAFEGTKSPIEVDQGNCQTDKQTIQDADGIGHRVQFF